MPTHKLEELKRFVSKNLEVELSLDGHSVMRTRRKLQHMALIKHSDKAVQSYYEVLLNHAFKAEKLSPESGYHLLKLFLGRQEDAQESSIRTKRDLINYLLKKKFDSKVKSMLCECVDLSSKNTKISIKKSSSNKTYVEECSGYVFNIKSLLKTSVHSVDNPKVACVDGYIESVSEIHHLLTGLSEKKVPCLLFVRGMSDDVLHTIKVNNDRKTFSVYPFLVPFDVENVNTLVDICVVSGNDVVSSTKGNLISTLTYDKLGQVENAIVNIEEIHLKNECSRNNVKLHLENLKNSLENRKEIEDILTKRINSLSSNRIDICLPDSLDYYSITSQLDEGIRIISSVFNKTYDPVEISKMMHEKFLNSVNDTEICLL